METGGPIEVKRPPSGIGGWLAFFIFGLFGNGVLSLINALSLSRSAASSSEYIVVSFEVALAALAFSSAVQLLRIKNQGITLAKIFLCSNLVVTALVVLGTFVESTGSGSASKAAQDSGRALLFSMLWLLYFKQSVRVRNTFRMTGKSKPPAAIPTQSPVVLEAAPPVAADAIPPVILKTTHRSGSLKYVLAGAVTLALVLGVMSVRVARSSAEKQAAIVSAPTIFYDDIAYQEDGRQFSTAFALESTCSGLSLMTWTNHTSEERMLGLKSEWHLSYATSPESGHGGGALYHRHAGADDGNFDFQVGFSSDQPGEAAQKVCSIVTSRGGTIR